MTITFIFSKYLCFTLSILTQDKSTVCLKVVLLELKSPLVTGVVFFFVLATLVNWTLRMYGTEEPPYDDVHGTDNLEKGTRDSRVDGGVTASASRCGLGVLANILLLRVSHSLLFSTLTLVT